MRTAKEFRVKADKVNAPLVNDCVGIMLPLIDELSDQGIYEIRYHFNDVSKGVLDLVIYRMRELGFDVRLIVSDQEPDRLFVSLKAAKVLFNLIKSGKDIKGFDIDGYTVIGLNGVLTIGCHVIERKEINRLAALLNWGQIEVH